MNMNFSVIHAGVDVHAHIPTVTTTHGGQLILDVYAISGTSESRTALIAAVRYRDFCNTDIL